MFRAVPAQANPDVQEGNWENWREIAEQRRQEERQRAAQKAHQRMGTQRQEQQGSPNIKNRQQQTTSYHQYQSSSSQQMKQEHYYQEQQSIKERQIQAIHQQNQAQAQQQQQRIMEPQQQQTNVNMKVASSKFSHEMSQDQRSLKEKKLALQQQRDHERRKRQEEQRILEQGTQHQQMKFEEEQRIQQKKFQEEKRFQEEQRIQEQKIQEEKRFHEEQRIQQQRRIQEEQRVQQQRAQEQKKIQEEQRIQQQRLEKEKKIQEQRRIQELKYFEEQQRLEETRLNEEKKRFEEQMRMEEQRKQAEQDLVIRQQRERFEAERKRYEQTQEHRQLFKHEEKHLARQIEPQKAEPKTRRAPKAKLQKAQSFNQEDMESLKTDHFANIKTGQVNEKRHFWMRSSSNERLNEQRFQSPGPRRRWIGEKDWIRQQALKNLDNTHPGSSLIPATDLGNVKHVAKDWSNIVKSKSSTAILQDDYETRSRPGSGLSRPIPSWLKEDQVSDSSSLLTRDIHTNQVKETVETWPSKSRETSQQPQSGRSTPAPTRHIGESFADNRIAKDGKVDLKYQGTSAKAGKAQSGHGPEPSLKLVNVAVMRSKHEDQDKITFSHTAQEQMKSFTSSETKVTTSSHSSHTSQEQSFSSSLTPSKTIGMQETFSEATKHEQPFQEHGKKVPPVIPFGTNSSKTTQNLNSQEHFQQMASKQQNAKAERTSLNKQGFTYKEQTENKKSTGSAFETSPNPKGLTTKGQDSYDQRDFTTQSYNQQSKEESVTNSFKSSTSKNYNSDFQQQPQNQATKSQEPREFFFSPPTQSTQQPSRSALETTPNQDKMSKNFSQTTSSQFHTVLENQSSQDSKFHSHGHIPAKVEAPPTKSPQTPIVEVQMQGVDNSFNKPETSKESSKRTFGRTPPKIPFSKGKTYEEGTQGKPPFPSPRIPSPDKRPPPTMPKPKMQPIVPLNVPSKDLEPPPPQGLPMPVSQSWFDPAREAEPSEVSSTSSFGQFERIGSPQGANKTPIPVLAGWFDEEQRKQKFQSTEPPITKPVAHNGAHVPIPPPPPPPQMNKKEKRVDFVEPPPFSPPPESDISSLNIEEMSEGGTDIDEVPIRGNVKGNIALFQEGNTGNRQKQGQQDWKDSMKGCVSQSRQAYVQQTSNVDKDDNERLLRQKELEEISKARARTNWDDVSPDEASESIKDSRTRELQAIAELRSKRAADAWEAERSSEKVLEATRDQRAKELQEIASMRSQNNWDEVNAEVRAKADKSQVIQEQRQLDQGQNEPLPQPVQRNPNDLDIDEMISSFQDVAASWQQRESEPQPSDNQAQRTAEVPSRRIGNLFKRPPAQTGESPHVPPPPPRESSKDYMMDVHQQNKAI